MSNQYGNGGDMYNGDSSRMNGSVAFNNSMNGGGLNRQSSRQFEQTPRAFGAPSNMYGDEDRVSNYETRTLDRSGIPSGYGQQQYSNGGFEPSANPWGQPSYGGASTLGAGSRMRNNGGGSRRPPIPHFDQGPSSVQSFSGSSFSPIDYPSGPSNGMSNGLQNGQQPSLLRPQSDINEDDIEELIPTAIVIKNIPFAIKREQLAQLMSDMGLPAPYAFNYHFDSGVFRGLAFANFQNPQDTAQVINAMNHMELQGRKLRVEYKKMLPQQERERIEREKRLRRGQLEEQHRAPAQGMDSSRTLTGMPSYSSLNSHHNAHSQSTSPSPVSHRSANPMAPRMDADVVDFNDPWTLSMYTDVVLFKRDETREIHTFGTAFTDTQRRVIHEIAQNVGLYHTSIAMGSDSLNKTIQLSKQNPDKLIMQNSQYSLGLQNAQDRDRRGLSRAATTDFTERADSNFNGLRNQNSAYLAPFGENNFQPSTLRGAKSFGDLQNRNPSPANSGAGFPSVLADNASRYISNMYTSGNSSASNLLRSGARDDLSASFNSLNVGGGLGSSNISGASRLGAVGSSAGAIGSHRSANGLNGNHDEQSQQSRAIASRQPRGPSDIYSPSGFHRSRPQRGSNDLDNESTDSLDSPVSGGPHSSRFPPPRN